MMKRYTNAMIFQNRDGFRQGSFLVRDGVFEGVSVCPGEDGSVKPGSDRDKDITGAESVDLEGAYVIPGLVDIHTHGNSGADFSDGDEEGLRKMSRYYGAHGITSFAPTSMSLPYEKLRAAFKTAAVCYADRERDAARIAGIHMEGPFFSEKKKGSQNAVYLRVPDYGAFLDLYQSCGGLVRIVDIAPELEGAEEFIRKASGICKVSAGHTDADYEQARAGFSAGVSHVTHLFNAMPPIHHRKPGLIGAAAGQENVVAELICDGLHVHPAMIRMAFRLFPGRICLISDSLRCCGMPDGLYELGGQRTFLKAGVARLEDGTIAGAAADLHQGLKKAISCGIPVEEAIMAATIIPAREIGAAERIGSIEIGKYADFLVCDDKLDIRQVYIGGERISSIT